MKNMTIDLFQNKKTAEYRSPQVSWMTELPILTNLGKNRLLHYSDKEKALGLYYFQFLDGHFATKRNRVQKRRESGVVLPEMIFDKTPKTQSITRQRLFKQVQTNARIIEFLYRQSLIHSVKIERLAKHVLNPETESILTDLTVQSGETPQPIWKLVEELKRDFATIKAKPSKISQQNWVTLEDLKNELAKRAATPKQIGQTRCYNKIDITKNSELVKQVLDGITVESPLIRSRDKIGVLLILILGIKISELARITVKDLKTLAAIEANKKFKIALIKNKAKQQRVFALTESEVAWFKKYENDFRLLFANPEYTDDHQFMNLSKEHLSRRFTRYFAPLKRQNEN